MKPKGLTIFSRIILLATALITGLALVFVVITYFVATNYYESATQLLNKDVAAHIAKFSAPFGPQGLNARKADSVFHDAMVLSPNNEVYFLDTTGAVVDYYDKSERPSIRLWQIDLAPIRRHIALGGAGYAKGQDPRDPSKLKIFSAAEVTRDGRRLGYIYVILAGSEARMVASGLLSNHVIILCIAAFSSIVLLSLALSFLYVRRAQRRFNRVVDVLERFRRGDFEARFPIVARDGLAPVKDAFNTMADMLAYQINRLTKSEEDRKAFIASITHDLRNPLAIAGGYAETLLMESRKGLLSRPQQDEYAQLMLQKVKQVETMVQQLHDLAAMDSIHYEPQREPFMFSELLQEVAQSFRNRADEKQLRINCDRCEDGAYIRADVGMMERVIQNLLANALAYSPGGQTIFISLRRESGDLVCRTENPGTLLPEPLLQWLNDGNDHRHAPLPNQSSLGLGIVKRILRIHGYRINAGNAGNRIVFEFVMPVFAMPGAA